MSYPVVIAPSLSSSGNWAQFFTGLTLETSPSRSPFLYVSDDLFIDYHWDHLLEQKTQAHLLIYGDGMGKLSLTEDFFIQEIPAKEHVDGLHFGGISLLNDLPQGPLELPAKRAVIGEKKWPHERPAIFLDRDGIIVEDNDYVVDYQQITLRQDFIKALPQLISGQTLLFVVSNQSGVGRGYFSSDQVTELHQKLDRDLKARGISIAEWIFCPYHKTQGQGDFKKDSFSRKPYPGMVLNLCQRHPVDLLRSWMIGDQPTDYLFLPQLRTVHLKASKDLSTATSPVFSDPQKLVQHIKEAQLKH